MVWTVFALPGRKPLGDDAARKHLERLWDTGISPDPGLSLIRMVEEAEKGNLKALYVMGENPLRSFPSRERVKKAFDRLELLIVQDILETETTAAAHVVLPGAAFAEKEGSYTSLEGRIQPFAAATGPPGEAKTDLSILGLLAEKMGGANVEPSIAALRAEMAKAVPQYREFTGKKDAEWLAGTSTRSLFDPLAKRNLLAFTKVVPAVEEAEDPKYPFVAVIDSLRCHLGSGTRTVLSPSIGAYAPEGAVWISEADALKAGLSGGDAVKVFSADGEMIRPVTIRKGIAPGTLFIPRAFEGNDVQNLVGLAVPESANPVKNGGCRVGIEKIPD